MSDVLALKQKVIDMTQYGYAALRQFPKSEKYALGSDIKICMHRIIRLVITANKRYHKKTTLQELDIEIELLMSLIRLGKELTFLPFRQYKLWAERIVEIGKMVGGWIKAQR